MGVSVLTHLMSRRQASGVRRVSGAPRRAMCGPAPHSSRNTRCRSRCCRTSLLVRS